MICWRLVMRSRARTTTWMSRTRPTTFAERAVKTFITRGMLGDMLIRVAQVHGLFEGIEDVWPFRAGALGACAPGPAD